MTNESSPKEPFTEKLSGWLGITFVCLLILWAPASLVLVIAGYLIEAVSLTAVTVILCVTIFYYLPMISRLCQSFSIWLFLRLLMLLLPSVLVIYGLATWI